MPIVAIFYVSFWMFVSLSNINNNILKNLPNSPPFKINETKKKNEKKILKSTGKARKKETKGRPKVKITILYRICKVPCKFQSIKTNKLLIILIFIR
jgi:hypothetical protein